MVSDGELTHYRFGRALRVAPEPDAAMVKRLADYYDRRYGLDANLPSVPEPPCRANRSRPSHVSERGRRRHRRHFAEAFDMRGTALVITADSARWALQAATTMTGFATSVIACGCEAGIDCELSRRRRRTAAPACACCCSRYPRRSCRSN